MTFSADGQYLVTGCGRRSDAKMDKKDATFGKSNKTRPPEGAAIHLVHDIRMWVPRPAIPPDSPLWRRTHPKIVTCVQISPDGSRVTGGGFEIRSWDLNPKGEPLKEESPQDIRESVAHLVFNPKKPSEAIACIPSGALSDSAHGQRDARVG